MSNVMAKREKQSIDKRRTKLKLPRHSIFVTGFAGALRFAYRELVLCESAE